MRAGARPAQARVKRVLRPRSLCALAALLVSGCAGPQSTLDAGGRGAERIAELFWLLTLGALLIWIVAVALWLYAVYRAERPASARSGRLIIVGGGVVVPTLILASVLSYSLLMLPDFLEPAPEGSLRIEVIGHQWWWRVRYLPGGDAPGAGEPVELANEIRLPVDEPVQLELETRDVIHSFWIPALGGKMDMIPGRRTRLKLEPTRVGIYRGACAEYCGTSHALMGLSVVVQEADEFEAWLEAQAASASAPPAGSSAERGREVFLANGCGACHAVRGTPADGVVGPDLTHVGGRLSLGAGTLPNDAESFRRFVELTDEVKPSVHMPAFDMLPPEDLDALAAYLESLQ